MATILVVVAIAGFLIMISMLLSSVEKEQKRKATSKLLHCFSELGSKYNLTFSSQEVLGNTVIGLDGMHRKLLVLNKEDPDFPGHYIIHLDEVRSCSLKRYYRAVNCNGEGDKSAQSFTEKLVLCFEFHHAKQPIEIPIYGHTADERFLVDTSHKARHWETILSKMINTASKKNSEP